MLRMSPLNVSFRKSISDEEQTRRLTYYSYSRIAFINLNEGLDSFICSLHKKIGTFTVKSIYMIFVNNRVNMRRENLHTKLTAEPKLSCPF